MPPTSSRFFRGATRASSSSLEDDVRALLREVRARRRRDRAREDAATEEEDDDDHDDEVITCAICLDAARSPCTLGGCAPNARASHVFCEDCITRWSAVANRCPLCKASFDVVHRRDGRSSFAVEARSPSGARGDGDDDDDDAMIAALMAALDETFCEVCAGGDDEDTMLLCDGCDRGFHIACLSPPLTALPAEEEEWRCPRCVDGTAEEEAADEAMDVADGEDAAAGGGDDDEEEEEEEEEVVVLDENAPPSPRAKTATALESFRYRGGGRVAP